MGVFKKNYNTLETKKKLSSLNLKPPFTKIRLYYYYFKNSFLDQLRQNDHYRAHFHQKSAKKLKLRVEKIA